MKKVLILLFIVLPALLFSQKMVKQSVTVFSSSQELKRVQYSIEAGIKELDSINLIYSDKLKSDPKDLQDFWARTPVQGLVLVEEIKGKIIVTLHSRSGKSEKLSFSDKQSIHNLLTIQKESRKRVDTFFPIKAQEIIVKEDLVIKTVSPLEYYRPTLFVGVNFSYSVFGNRYPGTNGDTLSFELNVLRPALVLDFHYKKFAFLLKAAPFIQNDTNPMNFNGSWSVQLIPGMWLARGFFYLGLKFNSYSLILNQFPTVFPFSIWSTFLYPRVGLKFSDSFMLYFTVVGIKLNMDIKDEATGSLSLKEEAISLDVDVETQISITPHWSLVFEFGFSDPMDLQSSNNDIAISENYLNLGMRYRFNMGGK